MALKSAFLRFVVVVAVLSVVVVDVFVVDVAVLSVVVVDVFVVDVAADFFFLGPITTSENMFNI